MKTNAASRTGLALLALAIVTSPAYAHHMMGGVLPSTFMQGLMSGLGHPVIGPDHFAFILAIGIAVAFLPAGLALIATFIVASTAGVLVHLGQFNIPYVEALVAVSLIVAATMLMLSRTRVSGPWIALACVAGLVHGYAFGESIVGAEREVLGAYLLGLALITAAVAMAVMALTQRLASANALSPNIVRISGAAIGILGTVLLVTSIATA
ncbi:MAG: HupE/UreJ family protein [Hyphomicrobiaceae bacterium]